MSEEEPITRDYKRGFGTSFHLLTFITDEEEVVAQLTERGNISIPPEGSEVTLRKDKAKSREETEEGEETQEEPPEGLRKTEEVRDAGTFIVEDVSYTYTLLEPPDDLLSIESLPEDVVKEAEDPKLELPEDRLFVDIDIRVAEI